MMQNYVYGYPNALFITILLTITLLEKLEIEKQCFISCMYIRLFCINRPIYTVFMQKTYRTYAYNIRFCRHKDTDLSAYTYICVDLHIRMYLLKRLFLLFQASFSSRIFVRNYVLRYQTNGYGFSLRYLHPNGHACANNAISGV